MSKTNVVHVYLDDAENKSLRDAAKNSGQTLAEFIRRAIAARTENPWVDQIETRDNDDLRESMRRYMNRGERG